MLKRARKVGLKLNPNKCNICKSEVAYVDHLLTREGLKPNPEHVQAINDMPIPTDMAMVQQSLGMIGYVHKFIPQLSEITKPLRIVLSKDIAWDWETD